MSTWINDATGQKLSFKAPATKVGGDEIVTQFPFVDSQALTISENKASATIAATETILTLGTENLSAACVLTVTPQLPIGAKLYVKFKCGGTKYDVTVKIGENTEATITGVANKTNLAAFLFDGTNLLSI